jgi:hypothetical protein
MPRPDHVQLTVSAPERFQAKRIPVRVKKTRKNKKLEHFHASMKLENAQVRLSRI